MTLPPSALISLDTNVLIHWIRQNPTGRFLREEYALEQRGDRPLYSTVVEGEIRGLATYLGWGQKRMEKLDEILAELVRVDAGHPSVVQAYAELYAAATGVAVITRGRMTCGSRPQRKRLTPSY